MCQACGTICFPPQVRNIAVMYCKLCGDELSCPDGLTQGGGETVDEAAPLPLPVLTGKDLPCDDYSLMRRLLTVR